MPIRASFHLQRFVELSMAAVSGQLHRYRAFPRVMTFADKTREEIETYQLERLRDLLVHAGRTVPYYRHLFQEFGFRPEKIADVRELEALPVTNKDTFREQGDRMISTDYEKSRLLLRSTGGSTGEPFKFYATPKEYEEQLAINLRSFALLGVYPGDRTAKIWGYDASQLAGNLISPLTGKLYFDTYRASPEEMTRWYHAMRLIRPKMIYAYASFVHHFARHLASLGGSIDGLQMVCSTAEKLFPEQREQIEQALGVRVFDMYGCHEVARLASECLAGRMHTAPDAAVLEFLPDRDAGAEGGSRMLVTSLLSYAMPFIRYDVGDYAHPLQGTCSCGLEFPLLSLDMGRVHHIYTLPGGRRIQTGVIHKPLYKVEHLRAFRICHRAIDRIEILAVPEPSYEQQVREGIDAVIEYLASKLGEETRVDVSLVAELPRVGRGKQPVVVSDVPEDTRFN